MRKNTAAGVSILALCMLMAAQEPMVDIDKKSPSESRGSAATYR
jgi:hypothetical protein